MKEILKLTLSLTFICAIAGAALAFVSQKTAAPREAARIAQRSDKMKMLLPEEATMVQEIFVEDGVTFFAGQNATGENVAYCAEGSDPNGFGGEIKILMGFTPDGTITGVMVSENSETPGIGSRACNRVERRSLWDLFKKEEDTTKTTRKFLPPNAYLDSFNTYTLVGEFQFGIQESEERVNGLVMPVSGATVSSTAIRNAANRISAAAAKHFHFEIPVKETTAQNQED